MQTKMPFMRHILLFIFILFLSVTACKRGGDKSSISIGINYQIDGQELVTHAPCYRNEAGNEFLVTEIQWFASNFAIEDLDGIWHPLNETGHVFYLDENSLHPFLCQPIKAGHYSALRFTFGLDETDNITGRFTNPPESEMWWPEPLGGGYHYMKLNGKWRNPDGLLVPFNVHLGIGQNEGLTQFYHNQFVVELPFNGPLAVTAEEKLSISISMNIGNWFRSPHTYDFNEWGGAIMQNQAAQQVLRENGLDVFQLSVTKEPKP